jgi:hypothetical protein
MNALGNFAAHGGERPRVPAAEHAGHDRRALRDDRLGMPRELVIGEWGKQPIDLRPLRRQSSALPILRRPILGAPGLQRCPLGLDGRYLGELGLDFADDEPSATRPPIYVRPRPIDQRGRDPRLAREPGQCRLSDARRREGFADFDVRSSR